MKKLFLSMALLIAAPFALCSQTMRVMPDSGYGEQIMNVTIVGIGTMFSYSGRASMVSIVLENQLEHVGPFYGSLVNDSTLACSITVPDAAPETYYNLIVQVDDTTERTFNQSNAFRVYSSPARITSVSPSSAYDSETVNITVTGQNTSFLAGSIPTISFLRSGTTYFTAQADTIYTNTSLGASVMIPNNIAAGNFDVIVHNGSYSDTGKAKFSVLGQGPTTTLVKMKVTPDSGFQEEQLTVTIVGIGTNFESTGNASMVSVRLTNSNNVSIPAYTSSFLNDSTITAFFVLGSPPVMPTGYYNVDIEVTNTSLHTFIGDSAFLVTSPPPSIVSVSPSSAYDSQTVSIQIGGQSTTFLSGTRPSIKFQLNGALFNAHLDSIYTNTLIGATLTVPATAPAGSYDIIVQNGTYSDTGKNKFNVLGPMPSVQLYPDSGAASTMFYVTIVGQNTNFAATSNASMHLNITIDLSQNGVLYYHTIADTVYSSVLADALFSLPDSIPQGTYDADIFGNTYNNGTYDLHTTFLVTPHVTIQLPFRFSAKPTDTVTIKVTGSRVNFVDGSESAIIVRLVNASGSIQAQNVNVTNDTTLFAFFSIPDTAKSGLYDVDVVEPGTQRTVIGSSKFTIDAGSGVTGINSYPQLVNSIVVAPNPAQDIASISFMMSEPGYVRLLLYDALGRTIATLCDRTIGSGFQSFKWSSANTAAGSIFYELTDGDETHLGRIVIKH